VRLPGALRVHRDQRRLRGGEAFDHILDEVHGRQFAAGTVAPALPSTWVHAT
jgi:hypothetical protein